MKKNISNILVLSALMMGCNAKTYQSDGGGGGENPSTPVLSQYWINYEASRQEDSDLINPEFMPDKGMIPPNFSYAGYQRGDAELPTEKDWQNYKTFDVTQFRAVANNGASDKQAFIAAANAISEYLSSGGEGAILYVPEGDYIVNSPDDMKAIDPGNLDDILNKQVIQIHGSNIVFKGAGKDKTRLIMTTHLLPESQARKWTTPYLFELGRRTFDAGTVVKITESVIADSQFSVQVADASGFSAGDFVEIKATITDPEKIVDSVSPYKPEFSKDGKPLWNISDGLIRMEKNEIERVEGQTVYFKAPVAHNIDSNDNWTVTKINPATNVGVQGITFKGSWSGNFVHHESALGNSGYSLLKLARTSHGWVRDVNVEDFNQGIQIINSSNVTVKDINMTGTPGHISLAFLYSNNVISKDVNDAANTWHGPGWSKYATRNVHLRTRYSEKMGPDIHGAQPMNNLYDQPEGGWVLGHWGAAIADQPNHLKGLYFWNAKNTGPASSSLTFMAGDSVYGRIIMPHLIGLHGNRLQVTPQYNYVRAANQQGWAKYDSYSDLDAPQAYVESNGREVRPVSLYEAQLELRQSLSK